MSTRSEYQTAFEVMPGQATNPAEDTLPVPDDSENQAHLLEETVFQNAKSLELLEAVDQLRECGVGRDISLPQVRDYTRLYSRNLLNCLGSL
jgi:hypothetical protein